MPQIITEIQIAQMAADLSDELTEHVCKRARQFGISNVPPGVVRKIMVREIEKVVAVQLLDGTRQNAGNGTDGSPAVPTHNR